MSIERQGRGAWPRDGAGGTLMADGIRPGPFYALSKNEWTVVGLAAPLRYLAGQSIPFSELAVHLGVKSIQTLLNDCVGVKTRVPVDGVYGPVTVRAVKELQKLGTVVEDGVVGQKTMRTLTLLPIFNAAKWYGVPWEAVYGILQYEGAWDPAAVGYADENDLGLAQINLNAHPHVTVNDAFRPSFAINFVCDYFLNAMRYLDNNTRDSVASYNLGIGGTRQWIADGRPDEWMPSWSTLLRKPNAYIDRILNAHML